MDPPFNSLFEMITQQHINEKNLIENIFTISPWLIVYVGHKTQSGRKSILQNVLKKHCKTLYLWDIEAEVVAIATLETGTERDNIISDVKRNLERDCREYYDWHIQPVKMI